MHFAFENTYARLPERFAARVVPSAAKRPRLIKFNGALAERLGLNPQDTDEIALAALFSGLTVPRGAEPLAMAYAGHQFGHFVPQLGDGRAILLGEVKGRDGIRYDVQLKGAGQTPFSRRGDGRAALGPVLREYIVSEAMAALGVPTTRSLAAVATGDAVYRETALPGAVLTRIARSHLRVGTFQFFAARRDLDALKTLMDYAIARHYPHAGEADTPALAFLEAVVAAQARLIAHWMSIGFIHGVMNTDNMAISGDTIDYGPCAFLDAYHPNTVFSSIDEHGRYAFANQPRIAQWNLARLAETLLPLIDADGARAAARATETLETFGPAFEASFTQLFRRKLGLHSERPGDLALIQGLLSAMAQGAADFTLTFRALAESTGPGAAAARDAFTEPSAFDAWTETWRARLAAEETTPAARISLMLAANPAFIPRNHRIEAVIQAATQSADFEPFHEMVSVLSYPFAEQPGRENYAQPPAPDERVERTFCGT
jgi:uncharacterized protein YdiU (UPF0061 family)